MDARQPSQRILDFHHEMWLDEDESTSFPARRPLLAHYTSLANLEKIASGRELWLSHPYLMNDHQELVWALSEGIRLVVSDPRFASVLGAQNYQEFVGLLEAIRSFDTVTDDLDTYIACFSEHARDDVDGVLSMWRAYGGNGGGAAIVFDTAKISDQAEAPLIISPVVYATTEARIAWIEGLIDKLVESMARAPVSKEDTADYAWNFYNRLRMFSLFTKHVGFSEEAEWRVVYDPKIRGKVSFARCLSYAVTSKGIEPKFKLPMDGSIDPSFDLDNVVHRVLLGPTAGTELAKFAASRMLNLLERPRMSGLVFAAGTPLKAC